MKKLITFCFILFLNFNYSSALIQNLSPLSLDSSEVNNLEIRLFKGSFTYLPDPSSKKIEISVKKSIESNKSSDPKSWLRAWSPNVINQKGKVIFEVHGPMDRKVWRGIFGNNMEVPDFIIEIRGPVKPLYIQMKEGDINLSKIDTDVRVTHQEGNIKIENLTGKLSIHSYKGNVSIANHEGPVSIESSEGTVNLTKINGSVKVDNNTGKTFINEVDGLLANSSHSAKIQIRHHKGNIKLTNALGETKVTGLEGRLTGESEQGDFILTGLEKSVVNVKSLAGHIDLRVKPGTGAIIRAVTEDGSIRAPKSFNNSHIGGSRVVKGRLPGGDLSRVVLRTKTGNIKVR